MAKLQNKRIKNTQETTPKNDKFIKPTIGKIKEYYASIKMKQKVFLLIFFIINIIAMILLGIFTTGITQSIWMCSLFLVDVLAIFIFNKWDACKRNNFIYAFVAFFVALTMVSTSFLLYGELGIDKSISINKEIASAKKNSIQVLTTDMAEIYVNLDTMEAHSVTDIADQKYVNTNKFALASESEYYFLYNVGIQMATPTTDIQEIYIYPPTPHTVTGYEYLLEIKYNNELYVTKIFLPGYVDLNKNVSATMFALTYSSTEEKYYIVNRIDEYLVFQSEYSTFSTPFKNVKYTSDQEYFYVRYNRYLEAYMDGGEYEAIDEKNVRFAKSLLTLSTTISKINFFWIGEEVNGSFVASIPVIEIIYDNGTCDIAIIKDIEPNSLKNAIT